jgi:signal transduction histidine kinase
MGSASAALGAQGNVGLFAPIENYAETLLHPAARRDAQSAARHRAFIATRILGSIVGLASLPIYLVVRGAPTAIETFVFAWPIVPILIAYFLSRTGRYEIAHALSSLSSTMLIMSIAVLNGGIASFATVWLIVAPLEAALSASPRVAATATIFALCAASFLALIGEEHSLPQVASNAHPALAGLGVILAALYTTGLALGAASLARKRNRHDQRLVETNGEERPMDVGKAHAIATVGHELRTPLNAIIGFSEMLMKENALALDSGRRDEYARVINKSGQHLLSIVNGMLDISKIETGNFEIAPETFAPASVVAACCSLLALKAREAGISLENDVAEGLPEIVADKRAFNQILINLLSNAIRFTDRDGRVTIKARAQTTDIAFVIEDNGVGISRESLAAIGEPYFQADGCPERRRGGTGLGLSIVKGLVSLHGGELCIHSRVGEGTRVTVRLPLDCERATKSRIHGASPRPVIRSSPEAGASGPMPLGVREIRSGRRIPEKVMVKKSA